jgi:AraC-like DNA-binding protein
VTLQWETIETPPDLAPPTPLTMRAQSIPARRYFPEHAHHWNQVVYAISGVLTVVMERRSLVITPAQAVWLPTGLVHRVGSLFGAEFRSLWIADEAGGGLPDTPTIFSVSPLLQALIIEAVEIEGTDDPDGYTDRVTQLILDQLKRAKSLPGALPWPRATSLTKLCEAIYTDPADARGPDEWGHELGMSGRTLARRFEAELGISLRSWRRRLRLFQGYRDARWRSRR